MADSKPGVHVVQLRPVVVPPSMVAGEKFIKWDEVTLYTLLIFPFFILNQSSSFFAGRMHHRLLQLHSGLTPTDTSCTGQIRMRCSSASLSVELWALDLILYYSLYVQETQILDMCNVRDSRTGRYAKVPKDSKMREQVNMGSQDLLEDKTITVAYGPDFVNVSFLNFATSKKDTAKVMMKHILSTQLCITVSVSWVISQEGSTLK